jgi:hypothetical protein
VGEGAETDATGDAGVGVEMISDWLDGSVEVAFWV